MPTNGIWTEADILTTLAYAQRRICDLEAENARLRGTIEALQRLDKPIYEG